MGCGESKHAISTADTISQSKRSSSNVKNVKDDDVKIPQKDENINKADIIAKLENVGNDIDAVQVSTEEANQKGNDDEINDSDKNKEADNKKNTEDVVVEQPVQEEKEMEKVKEDEIKEVKIANVADEAEDKDHKVEDKDHKDEDDAINKVVSDIKIVEGAHKEDEVNPIKEETEKTTEIKESSDFEEETIQSVKEKVNESAGKDLKST